MKKILALILMICPAISYGSTLDEAKQVRFKSGAQAAYVWHLENKTSATNNYDLLLEYYTTLIDTTRCLTARQVSKKLSSIKPEKEPENAKMWTEKCSFLPENTFSLTTTYTRQDNNETPWFTSVQPSPQQSQIGLEHNLRIPMQSHAFTLNTRISKTKTFEYLQTRFGIGHRINQGTMAYGLWMSVVNSDLAQGLWASYQRHFNFVHHIYAELNHCPKCKRSTTAHFSYNYNPKIGRSWVARMWTSSANDSRLEISHERQRTASKKTTYSLKWDDVNNFDDIKAHIQLDYHMPTLNVRPFAGLSHRLGKTEDGFSPNFSLGFKTEF